MTDVIYIGGFGRSGTTLFERLLDQSRQVTALGEVVHLWYRGVLWDEECGCGEPFSRCPFWTEVGRRAFGGWNDINVKLVHAQSLSVDRTRAIPMTLLARRWPERHRTVLSYANHYAKIYAAAAQISGSSVIVDSSKHPSTAAALAAHPDLRVHVLQLVRDSRGVAYSWTKRVERPEAAVGLEHRYMETYRSWTSTLKWDLHNGAFAALRRAGIPVHLVRYEDFVAAPTTVLNRLAAQLGLDPVLLTAAVHERTVELVPGHSVAGNPMRFQTGEVVLRSDDEWRRELPAWERTLVTGLSLPQLLSYGYLRPRKSYG